MTFRTSSTESSDQLGFHFSFWNEAVFERRPRTDRSDKASALEPFSPFWHFKNYSSFISRSLFPLHACLCVPHVSSAICILSLRYAWPFSQELVSSAGQSFSYSQPVCLSLRLRVQPQGTPDLKAQRRCMHDTLLKERMRLPEFQTTLVQTFT